jgi:hypothetical protein
LKTTGVNIGEEYHRKEEKSVKDCSSYRIIILIIINPFAVQIDNNNNNNNNSEKKNDKEPRILLPVTCTDKCRQK